MSYFRDLLPVRSRSLFFVHLDNKHRFKTKAMSIQKTVLIVTAILCSSLLWAQPLDMSLFEQFNTRNIGPAGMSGRVTAVDAVRENPDIIFIGTAAGGVWKSESGGTHWKPLFQNEKVASIGAIAINPQNPNDIWVGTGEGNPRNSLTSGYGIYRSLDGGTTWTFKGLGPTRHIHRIIIHPQNPDVIWVGAIGYPWGEHPERGVYKTQDGGLTWKHTLYVNEKTGCADLVIDPTNPNKLIAAMWEHRRWPWYFNSGGPGSGLYVSYDGGETWQQKTAKNGLPSGNLGRIGLAIAPSMPNRVYALVEAKKNGLYRSDDGGSSWEIVSTKNIGGRPFYYADLFVDPKNENRLINVHTRVEISQDGGKTFGPFIPTDLIHVDNHAFYIHPDDPSFMINGNDGGLAITRDAGKTWDFPENLPLAQFYHIRVDDAIPYHVYGGLQDNGSWRGPSQVWRRKGIRNLYWNRIGYGDGFDAAPDPTDERYGYALSQGGNLLRYDLSTGALQSARPYLADGTPLRFNWNAALAIDPHNKKTVYLGSQYVLASDDHGKSWRAISPDLTTNDSTKQQQRTTGGLSFDNTGAEMHTTLLAISVSPAEKNVIWAGSDDGLVHVTRNGGISWSRVSDGLQDLPPGSWINQIQVTKRAGEALVVANNYRRDDWTPYLYRTRDYGKTWQKLVQPNQIWGYCLSVIQDPVVPNLLFLGTEFGLYISIDDGQHWTKWDRNYPTVSTMDMALQEREADLVLGTFGRAVWILDDIRPFRTIAQIGQENLKNKPVHIFTTPPAYLTHLGEPNGYRSTGHGLFVGENRQQGALISYYVQNAGQKAQIDILNAAGDTIRTIYHRPDAGINRITWNLTQKGIRFPTRPKPSNPEYQPQGRSVLPGTYTIRIKYDQQQSETTCTVRIDPKIPLTTEELHQKAALLDQMEALTGDVTTRADQIRDAQKSLALILDLSEKHNKHALCHQLKKAQADLEKLMESITGPQGLQGIYRDNESIGSLLRTPARLLQGLLFAPSPAQASAIQNTQHAVQVKLEAIDAYFEEPWQNLKMAIDQADLSIIE